MTLFKPAESTQTVPKIGIMGFQGSGKTFTGTELAIGIIKLLRERKVPGSDRPAYFMDSETGSDYVMPKFKEAGIALEVAKTRAFTDLIAGSKEAGEKGSLLLVDSVTHYWRELCEAYQKKRGVSRLEFQDWAYLKGSDGWAKFTDFFVNSPLPMIVCGRAGYEYDFEENERGKKELIKTGIKMKTEGEFGFEPSLLVLMERETDVETKKVHRTAYVLKDRFDVIDGKEFKNPTFKDFAPHVERLNLGGKHFGFDADRGSQDMINREGKPQWKIDKERKVVALDEILEVLRKKHPGTSQQATTAKADLLETFGGTRSWTKIEADFTLAQVIDLREKLWVEVYGEPYKAPQAPAQADKLQDDIPV